MDCACLLQMQMQVFVIDPTVMKLDGLYFFTFSICFNIYLHLIPLKAKGQVNTSF